MFQLLSLHQILVITVMDGKLVLTLLLEGNILIILWEVILKHEGPALHRYKKEIGNPLELRLF